MQAYSKTAQAQAQALSSAVQNAFKTVNAIAAQCSAMQSNPQAFTLMQLHNMQEVQHFLLLASNALDDAQLTAHAVHNEAREITL
jgi:hypothetical protein